MISNRIGVKRHFWQKWEPFVYPAQEGWILWQKSISVGQKRVATPFSFLWDFVHLHRHSLPYQNPSPQAKTFSWILRVAQTSAFQGIDPKKTDCRWPTITSPSAWIAAWTEGLHSGREVRVFVVGLPSSLRDSGSAKVDQITHVPKWA